MNHSEINEVMEGLVQWHQNRVANCRLVIDNTNADLCMKTEDGQEFIIKADSRDARLVRLGWMLALEQFTPFPLSINHQSDDEEGCDDE